MEFHAWDSYSVSCVAFLTSFFPRFELLKAHCIPWTEHLQYTANNETQDHSLVLSHLLVVAIVYIGWYVVQLYYVIVMVFFSLFLTQRQHSRTNFQVCNEDYCEIISTWKQRRSCQLNGNTLGFLFSEWVELVLSVEGEYSQLFPQFIAFRKAEA